ncbi:MAG: protein kinase, partial [Chthoniobacterales bacterium]
MFSENYSVCLDDDGLPREIGRNGPVVTYKAIGDDSGRTVAMQLIPLASLSEGERVRFEESAQAARKLDHDNIARVFDTGAEDDHLVFVSEYVEGESAAEWIDEHGPMPVDAVLRIGFQVANALAAAEERGVAPRAIQPANLIILPGMAADGGWPGVKVRNFGLPTVKLNSGEAETRELVPSMPPQFASPEQRENRALDVRSDIFSLGATMWFLLSGDAPSLAESNPRLSAPDVPRFVRNLVSHMLRTDPEQRPQDLGAFAERIRACLQKAERRTAFTRSFAPAAIPGTQKVEKKRVAPALALAAAIVVLAAFGAFFLPERLANRERKPLGVLIGVPEATPAASPISQSSAAPVALPQQGEQSPVIAQRSPIPASPPTAAETTDKLAASPQLAVNNRMAEPPAPAEGPGQTSQPLVAAEARPPAEKSEPSPSAVPDSSGTAAKDSSSTLAEKAKPPNSSENVRKRDDSRASKRKSRHQRVARSSVRRPLAPLRVGSESARVVGTTANGNWVLRLPSGETVIAPPVP